MSFDAIGTVCQDTTRSKPAAAMVHPGRATTLGFITVNSQLEARKANVERRAVYRPNDRPRSKEYGTTIKK